MIFLINLNFFALHFGIRSFNYIVSEISTSKFQNSETYRKNLNNNPILTNHWVAVEIMNVHILFCHLNSWRILKTLSLFSVKQNLFSKNMFFFPASKGKNSIIVKKGIFLAAKKFYKTFDFHLHQIIRKLVHGRLFKSIRFDKIYGFLQADINFRSLNPLFFCFLPTSKIEFRGRCVNWWTENRG